MKPSSAKAKGRALQQRIRDLILELFPDLEPGDVRSTSMGAPGEDIQLSPKARYHLPVVIECKAIAHVAAARFYDQAVQHRGPDDGHLTPIAIFKENHSAPLAIIDAETLLELYADRAAHHEIVERYMRLSRDLSIAIRP